MANYPQGIRLGVTDVILELVDETPINNFTSPNIGAGYVRQCGVSAYFNVDDLVQYRTTGSLQFIQLAVTYALVTSDNILFSQAVIPPA